MLMSDNYQGQIILSREEVRAFDQWAINTLGIPESVLMENAGSSAARVFMQRYSREGARVLILCGCGNNGGDGFVVARHLLNVGYNVEVLVFGSLRKLKGAARINYEILNKILDETVSIDISCPNWQEEISNSISRSTLIVDALLGTGFKAPLREGYSELIKLINQSQRCVFAIDIPSGLDANLGVLDSPVIKADCSVSFVALKKGFLTPSAQLYIGEICIASIGIDVRFKHH